MNRQMKKVEISEIDLIAYKNEEYGKSGIPD